MRYEGTDTALPVLLSEPDMMRRDFEAEHRSRFGFISPEKRLFVAHIEVEAVGGGAECQSFAAQRSGVSTPLERVRIYSGVAGMTPVSIDAKQSRRKIGSPDRRSSSNRIRPWWSKPVGRRR